MTTLQSIPPTRIDLPAQDAAIRATLDFSDTFAAALGFNPKEQQQLRLALEEIIVFLRESGSFSKDTSPLALAFEVRADGLALRISAKGLPLDIKQMPDYCPKRLGDDSSLDGLSLYLAKKSVDQLLFSNHGREGIEALLLKTRASAHVQQIMPAEQLSSPPECAAAVAAYTIRPARDEEALEISRCAWMTYGYTYEDYIYYPERIIELNRSGELRSLVAVSDEEQRVIGHVALKFSLGHPDRAELGVLFVHPDFRLHGLGSALWQAATQLGRELGLQSVFARSVTGHRASQVMAQHNGFHDSALALALFPDAVDLKQMGGIQQGKMSGMFQCIQLVAPRPRLLHLPERYRDIAAELYRRAKIPCTVRCHTNADVTASGEPLYRVRSIPILNIGVQEVENIGPSHTEAGQWINRTHRRLCREKFDVIYLYINCQQGGGAHLAEHAAQNGYVFSGIIPGHFPAADAIAMQYLNLPGNPFENITTWTDTAQLLRTFIESEWRQHENQPQSRLASALTGEPRSAQAETIGKPR